MKWLFKEDHQALSEEAADLAARFSVCREAIRRKFSDEQEFDDQIFFLSKGSCSPPADEIPGLTDLAKSFAVLHPTSDTTSGKKNLHNEIIEEGLCTAQGDKLQQIMYDLIAELELRKKALALPLKDFESELRQEYKKCAWQLRHWNDAMKKADYPDFDSGRLFEEVGIGYGRVLRSRPVIAPYFATSGISPGGFMEKNTPWMLDSLVGKIGDTDYDFGLGFLERDIKENKNSKDKEKKLFMPLLCLDRKVLSALSDMMDNSTSKEHKTLAANILISFRQFFTLSIHDYIHQSMYGDMFEITIQNRTKLSADKPPIHEDGEGLPSTFIWPMNKLSSNLTSNEQHAELLLRDTWRHIFELKKEESSFSGQQVKNNIIGQAVRFLDNLEIFRRIQVEKLGEDMANKITTYLAVLAMGRFHRIIDMSDPALRTQYFTLGDKKVSFEQAADQLLIQSYSPKAEEVLQNLNNDPSSGNNYLCVAANKDSIFNEIEKRHDIQFWKNLFQNAGIEIDASQMSSLIKQSIKIALLFSNTDSNGIAPNTAQLIEFIINKKEEETEKLFFFGLGVDNFNDWKITKQIIAGIAGQKNNALNAQVVTIINDFRIFTTQNATPTYVCKRINTWLGEELASDPVNRANQIKKLRLSGMDGLQARVLFQGSTVSGWLNNYQPWIDIKYPAADVAAQYYDMFTHPDVLVKRPTFAAAVKKFKGDTETPGEISL